MRMIVLEFTAIALFMLSLGPSILPSRVWEVSPGETCCMESVAAPQDPIPNEKDVRRRIDSRIDLFVKGGRRLNPGFVKECISDTLAFGVPAFNAGDHEACARSYVKTAESLVSSFPSEERSTPLGWRALSDLKAALKRTGSSKDADDRAWAIRFAFDKVLITWESQATQERALMGLGNQNFGQGRYVEAAEAYQDAAVLLSEIVGENLGQVEPAARSASLMSGHAYLASGKLKEAILAIQMGLSFVPDFPKSPFDLRTLYRADRYEKIVEGVKAAAQASPEDADLAFLLGYLYYHSGKKEEAGKEFERAQKIAPEHAATRLYRGEERLEPKKKAKEF
jgi:tetratricopeptide (TPR) repeat protein